MVLKNNKSLGQHWLKDRATLDAIADYSCIFDTNLCIEIGPGLGTLTSSLLKCFDKVIAVEYDSRLAENLPKSFPGKNLEVINMDFLKFNLESIKEPYAVAGNIPYYITSPIIMKLIETKNLPKRIVLLIQKEVAERIAARDNKESVLSLSVKNRADVELGPVVKRELFTPPPKVDSQVIILDPHPPIVSEEVIKLVKRGFSAPRKKLVKNLGLEKTKAGQVFNSLGLSPDARPADLSLSDWQNLQATLSI
ncbi:ribosomal RNA small subunit methyltransferase A [Candidatus Saccharibacteria bacterium]|nr:ribosomal RNA small subunit methyltransferase A [Candidatus Saccharibacteria bacterium]